MNLSSDGLAHRHPTTISEGDTLDFTWHPSGAEGSPLGGELPSNPVIDIDVQKFAPDRALPKTQSATPACKPLVLIVISLALFGFLEPKRAL